MWPFDDDSNQAAQPAADASGYGGLLSPGALFDNKDFRRHAAYDALTNAGLGLMAASAPSITPQNLGTAFGGLAGGAAAGVQGSADRYMKQMQLAAQMQNMRMRQQMMQGVLNSPDPTAAPQAAPQDAGAPAPAPAAAGAPNSLGITDNNIANVEAPKGSPTRFAQVPDFNGGVALAAKNVQSYPDRFNGGKPMDLTQIGSHWAPAGDGANDPKQWAVNVSLHSGLPINQPLDLSNPEVAAKVVRGIHGAEKGAKAVQAPEAYMPGVQLAQAGGPQPMPQGGDQQPAGNQPGVMPAPQQGGIQLPPPPQAMPIPKQLNAMLLSGDPGMKAMAQSRIAQINTLNSNAMERWKANVALLQHNQTEARERQGMDLRTQNADVMPGGNLNQTKIEYGAQAELAKKKAEGDAHEQSVLGGKGWQDAPPDQFRKIANPQVISLADGLQKGTIRLSTLNSTTGRGGISITKDDVQAAGLKLYGDHWNPDSGDIRHKFEQDIKDTDTQAGKTTYALNVLNKHIDRFQDLMLAQKNGTAAPLMTKIRKELNDAAGYNKYTSAESLQPALATEMASAIKGSILNEPEVLGAIEQLKTTKSDPQMLDTLHTLRHTVGDRTSTFLEKAKDAYVPQDRIDRIIGPSAKAAGEHFDKVQEEYRAAHPEQFGAQPNAPASKGAIRTFDPATGTLK